MESNGSAAVPVQSSGLSLKGLYEVIFSPNSFFEKLKSQPRILVPYIFLVVAMFVGLYLMSDLSAEVQLQAMRDQGRPLPPRDILKWGSVIGGTVVMGLYPLLAAGLALFWGNVVMAGTAKFRQLLSVMLYGEVIAIIGMFVTLPLMLKKGTILVSISLGALVTPDPKSTAFILLSRVSVWIVWEIVVVGLGFAAMYGFPRNKGYTMSVLTIGLLSVIGALLSLLGGMFG